MENVGFTIIGLRFCRYLKINLFFSHRYFAKCLEEMFQNACRTCSMIIFPVSINSIIIVWYLINFSKVTKGWQKFWGSSEGKMFEVKRCFHVQMF